MRGRQFDEHFCAFIFFAHQSDLPFHQMDELLAEDQAKAGTRFIGCTAAFYLTVEPEKLLQGFWRYPYSSVRAANKNRSFGVMTGECDGSSGRCKFNRIVCDVKALVSTKFFV